MSFPEVPRLFESGLGAGSRVGLCQSVDTPQVTVAGRTAPAPSMFGGSPEYFGRLGQRQANHPLGAPKFALKGEGVEKPPCAHPQTPTTFRRKESPSAGLPTTETSPTFPQGWQSSVSHRPVRGRPAGLDQRASRNPWVFRCCIQLALTNWNTTETHAQCKCIQPAYCRTMISDD